MPTHLTVKGVVLRETPVGEADKLFDLMTENGILTVRARSVRKAGSKYAAVTQSFSCGEFCLRVSGERYYLDSAVPIELFYGLRTDLNALALAAYFSEVIRKTATQQSQPQLLRLFFMSLRHLSQQDRPPEMVKAVFEMRLAAVLGMAPNLICCGRCMEYLPETAVFRIADADFVCGSCYTPAAAEDGTEEPVLHGSRAVLQAARHIIFAEESRLFQFRLGERSLRILAEYTERYLLHRLEMYFPTLKFYRGLLMPEAPA